MPGEAQITPALPTWKTFWKCCVQISYHRLSNLKGVCAFLKSIIHFIFFKLKSFPCEFWLMNKGKKWMRLSIKCPTHTPTPALVWKKTKQKKMHLPSLDYNKYINRGIKHCLSHYNILLLLPRSLVQFSVPTLGGWWLSLTPGSWIQCPLLAATGITVTCSSHPHTHMHIIKSKNASWEVNKQMDNERTHLLFLL